MPVSVVLQNLRNTEKRFTKIGNSKIDEESQLCHTTLQRENVSRIHFSLNYFASLIMELNLCFRNQMFNPLICCFRETLNHLTYLLHTARMF